MPAEFLTSLKSLEIAEQVASLLNVYNDLSFKRTSVDVLNGKTNYVVELHGSLLLGCCGIERLNYQITEIKHLVVRPDWQRKGIGRYLVRKAVDRTESPILYATIREDNKASMMLFASLGFRESLSYTSENHNVILVVKANPKWKVPRPDWKSVSAPEEEMT